MKGINMSFMAIFPLLFAGMVDAQSDLSTAMLKPLRGNLVTFSSVTQKDSVVLVCFWASTSDISVDELNAINANYEKWKSSIHFKMLAVSVDEGKSVSRVRPTVNMNGWVFDVYTDINGDLQKALNSNNLPQSMIIKNGKVLYRQSGFQKGTENYLFQKIIAISEGVLK
jgi:hypothetical protein